MNNNVWDGIANGDEFTMEQKAKARKDADLPEDNERYLMMTLGPAVAADGTPHDGVASAIKELWRHGRIDVITNEHGLGAIGMSTEQGKWWQSAVSEDRSQW